MTVSARRRFYAMALREETIGVAVQEICRGDDVHAGNRSVVEMGEVIFVAGYEVVDAGGNGGSENGSIFGDECDRSRNEANVGIADDLCSRKKAFETLFVATKSEVP